MVLKKFYYNYSLGKKFYINFILLIRSFFFLFVFLEAKIRLLKFFKLMI